ncbi:MAG: cupin domain-containing protein [Planctomycetaceae bacterium]
MTETRSGSHYIDVAGLPWKQTRFPGIEMKILFQEPNGEAFTAMFRVAPGSKLPKHRHLGIEQTYIIEGNLADEDGICTTGNFVWREVGSVHSAHSPDGCLTIGIFQRANEFFDEDPAHQPPE